MPPQPKIQLFNDDCIRRMQKITRKSIDLVLTDPPYGTTKCKWDSIIPLDQMWRCIHRVTKPTTPILICCQQPFTSILISSNLSEFRYMWVWEKTVPTGHLNANRMPMKWYEEIAVFYQKLPTYNPQLREGKGYSVKLSDVHSKNYGNQRNVGISENDGTQYKPKDIIGPFKNVNRGGKLHPTQKPLELIEYLIKTYSNPGDTVLDFTMGSGTTGEACVRLDRKFIGIENDTEHGYFETAKNRIFNTKKKRPHAPAAPKKV